MYNKFSSVKLLASVLAAVSCLAFAAMPQNARAAGLGKITVFSALGQPLRAEVELSATREELAGMKAQLASQDAFRLAGLDYATTLTGVRFVIDKRAGGSSVIKLSSDKPIIDPFVDMLLELSWATGRLVREYTFLLDPPEVAGKTAVVETPVGFRYTDTTRSVAEPVPVIVRDVPQPRARDESRTVDRDGDARQVRRGETLGKIASETKPEGVSLEQMLVGLFRSNKDAFDGNMNRLKAGRVLSVPDKASVESLSQSEAKKIVLTQAADWNNYRRNLAGLAARSSPVDDDSGKREAAGKVTAKVEDKAAPVNEAKDQVKVSKAAAAAAKRTEEELIARDKALREANDRVSSLEKNVTDLQKLVELKNQSLAALQKQLAAKTVVPEPVKQQPVETKKPEPEVKPQPVAPIQAPPVVQPVAEKPVEIKPVEVPPVKPAAQPPEVKPEPRPESKPVEPPKPNLEEVVAPPPEEPDFVEELIDSPLALAGGGILALLAGLFLVKRRKKSEEDIPPAVRSALASRSALPGRSTLAPPGGNSTPSSVFRSTGGQSIDTSYVPPPSDFSQVGPGNIDTDEVDPVAEADVYMAYGRDAQAEEILLEAKQKDPKRYAIHLKLLEIYANRKNNKQFETLATDFYGETGGVGPEWERAAAMGLKLDPKNPLYGGAGPAVEPTNAPSSHAAPHEFDVVQLAQQTTDASPRSAGTFAPPVTEPVAADQIEEKTVVLPPKAVETAALDFDLGEPSPALQEPEFEESSVAGLDFSLPDDTPVAPRTFSAPEPTQSHSDTDLDFDLEFDVKMTESTVLGQSMQTPAFDMTSISLDLDDLAAGSESGRDQGVGRPMSIPEIEPLQSPVVASHTKDETINHTEPSFDEIDVSSNEEVATKLDLANAYEEMGDLEGVRELLQEVLKEGNSAQREKAQEMLARIG